MTYFQRSAEYYILHIKLSGPENCRILGERCRAKYPRGINLVVVNNKDLGRTFAPDHFVDPGRIFLTYDRLVNEALNPPPDTNEPFWKEIKSMTETYDPLKEILFVVMRVGGHDHEAYVYRVNI